MQALIIKKKFGFIYGAIEEPNMQIQKNLTLESV